MKLHTAVVLTSLVLVLVASLLAGAAPARGDDPITFQTMTWLPYWSPQAHMAVSGQPHTFGFSVFYKDPSAVVTAGELVFTAWNEDTDQLQTVATVPITGIDHYAIENHFADPTPVRNSFTWPACTLPPGDYSWHVVVTIGGVANHHFDAGDLHVSLFAINDSVGYTKNPTVSLAYFPPAGDAYFQVSRSETAWPTEWQTVAATDRKVSWDLPSARDGWKSVFMRFADAADGSGTVATASSWIVLDRRGPTTTAPYPASAAKGQYVRLRYGVWDKFSAAIMPKIKIRNRAGDLVMTLTLARKVSCAPSTTYGKRFRCDLPKGTYRFSVFATDQAGNKQANVASNTLTVK